MRTRTLVLPAVVALVPHARAGPVLATNNGVVLKIGERIEVLRDDGLPTRVISTRFLTTCARGRHRFACGFPPNDTVTVRYQTARMEARPTRD